MFCSQCGANKSQEAKFCASCGTPFSPGEESAVTQPATLPKKTKLAGFWFRTLAAVIDVLLCQVATLFITMPFGFILGFSLAITSNHSHIRSMATLMGVVLGILIQWLWFTIPESSQWQASLGKKIVGLKVTDENGERIGFAKANGRYWSKILSSLILFVGFLMIAFTEKKQGLHDKIAGTLVIRKNA